MNELYFCFQVGVPVYCMTINPRRGQMVCGVNAGIRVFELDEGKINNWLG